MAEGETCVECGKYFPADELVRLNNSAVCGACKPIFLQRLSEGATLPGRMLWRKGKVVILTPGTNFPDRCVFCNEPAKGFRLKHAPPGILFGALKVAGGRAPLTYAVCPRHRKRRSVGRIISWSGRGLGLAMFFGSIWLGDWLRNLGIVCIIGGVLGGVLLMGNIMVMKKMEKIWVTGCKRPFLDSLPEWSES